MTIAPALTAQRAAHGGRRQRGRRVRAALGAVLCAGALIACSSTSSSTGTTAATSAAESSAAAAPSSATAGGQPGNEQLCQSRDQLKASISALTNPALLTGGADGIKTALGQVQADLQGLVAAGKQDYQPQIDALQSSLKSVESAVGQVGNGGGAGNLLAVGSAVTATGSAASELFTALTAACGS